MFEISRAREHLHRFDFHSLFVEELGWSRPSIRMVTHITAAGLPFELREIAELGGVVVFEVTSPDNHIPNADTRKAVHKEISSRFHENLLIFVDAVSQAQRTQSLWYWVKREDNKSIAREHHYFREQPGDLFLGKLSSMFVDLGDLDTFGTSRFWT